MSASYDLHLTGDDAADALLSSNPLALLMGMLLDQQVPMEWAFASPLKLQERMGEDLTPAAVSSRDPDALEELFRQKPALHRYPGSMAKRTHALCQYLVEEYGGHTTALWDDAESGKELFKRLSDLPGFGKQKAQIFLALLGKQCGVTPDGWREAAGDYGKDGYRSIADVVSPQALDEVREYKRAKKAKA